jgi:sugar/nucleoside kinase (ribokinase family)
VDLIIQGQAPVNFNDLKSWTGQSNINCLMAGAIGYFSQNLAKIGCNVHLTSCIADDSFGSMILSTLGKAGINPEYIQVEKGKEGAIAVFLLLFGSNKRPMTFKLPTHHGWPQHINEKTEEYLLDSDALHCGGYLHFEDLWNNDVPNLFAKAREKGLITSLDPQFPLKELNPPWSKVLNAILKNTDVLLLDENEALGVSGASSIEKSIPILRTLGPKIVVIKQGEKGAKILTDKLEFDQPAIKPNVLVDSIGAGDSFDAGFLYGLLHKLNLKKCAYLGAYAASKSCEGIGGTSTFPTEKEITSIIKTLQRE